jgi:hypothetical protein
LFQIIARHHSALQAEASFHGCQSDAICIGKSRPSATKRAGHLSVQSRSKQHTENQSDIRNRKLADHDADARRPFVASKPTRVAVQIAAPNG